MQSVAPLHVRIRHGEAARSVPYGRDGLADGILDDGINRNFALLRIEKHHRNAHGLTVLRDLVVIVIGLSSSSHFTLHWLS
jgi:hypothetical protein